MARQLLQVLAAALAVMGVHGKSLLDRQQCSVTLTPSYPAPVVASGWSSKLIVKGLTTPRSIIFDGAGALLVVQANTGIVRITFTDNGGTCLVASTPKTVLSQNDLSHSLALSPDGKTLYASSAEAVYSWTYNSATGTLGTTRTTVISNMTNPDHVSRTLRFSKKQPNVLLVSRGSGANIDPLTRVLANGISQVKAFDVTAKPSGRAYNYASEGIVLGWGLRNDVGVDEHPQTGGIYSIENSLDQLTRQGTDIHNDNPGEELNYLGTLASRPATPPNYGYPDCVALWSKTNVPDSADLNVGTQFAVAAETSTLNDTTCQKERVAPRLTFQAHTAPLDFLFTPDGATAYVSFHGSWNRSPPIGYKLSSIDFANGEPVAASTSTTAAKDIMTNANLSGCPNSCFRPVGLALDTKGRLFMSSDSTGEIYVLQRG